jgi:predicted AlkP superfamily phosphohydrolase/phosphomutase
MNVRSTKTFPKSKNSRLIILGLDGATFDLILPWAEQGKLPNLAKIMQEGCWGPLRTVIPPSTAVAWNSFASGKGPGRHGLFEFMRRRQNSYRLEPVNSDEVQSARLWDFMAFHNKPSIILNLPISYPVRPINGCMVAGLPVPSEGPHRCHPENLIEELEKVAPGYKLLPTISFTGNNEGEYLADLQDTLRSKIIAARHLLRHKPWELFVQVFSETDFSMHSFWRYLDKSHSKFRPEDHARFGEAVLSIYRLIDDFIGELRRDYPRVPLMMVSDHGFGPLEYYLYSNAWLLREGFLKPRNDLRSRLKYSAFKLGFSPSNIFALINRVGLSKVKRKVKGTSGGYGLVEKVFFSFPDIDWRRSQAYSIGGGIAGLIFLNVDGREPEGTVEPGVEYERVRNTIIARLHEFRDPRTGEKIVGEIYKREDLFDGPFAQNGPDIVFFPVDPRYIVFSSFSFSSHQVIRDPGNYITGQHRMDGIFLMHGAKVKPGSRLQNARIIDAAPTALYLMGYPVPNDMDGKVLADGITIETLQQQPVDFMEFAFTKNGETMAYSDADREEVEARLKSLGYL